MKSKYSTILYTSFETLRDIDWLLNMNYNKNGN
jgi:hypothetical protein